MPILYSCLSLSRKRLEATGFARDPLVHMHEPMGFHDYNKLQSNAFCVVSDSDTQKVSTKVVKIIQSYTGIVDKMVWRKSLWAAAALHRILRISARFVDSGGLAGPSFFENSIGLLNGCLRLLRVPLR